MTALLYTSCDFVGSKVVASREVATINWPPLTGLPAALAAGAVVGAAAGAVVGAAAGAVVGLGAAAAVVGAEVALGAGFAAGPQAAANRLTAKVNGTRKDSLP